jgi:hypothetical protein
MEFKKGYKQIEQQKILLRNNIIEKKVIIKQSTPKRKGQEVIYAKTKQSKEVKK